VLDNRRREPMAAIGQSLYAGSLPTVWLARTRCRYNAIITVRVAR
jgi:hypothetical protein